MSRVVRLAVLGAFVAAAAVMAAGEEKFGKGVTLTDATPIKALYEKPADFVGKTIRIDGVALWEKDGGKSGHWRRPEA